MFGLSLPSVLTDLFSLSLLQLALPPDQASAAGQTATSWRERSSSSTWGRSRPRKANRCTAVWYVNKIQTPPTTVCCHCFILSRFNGVDVKIDINWFLLTGFKWKRGQHIQGYLDEGSFMSLELKICLSEEYWNI